ncbi:hypothetical protein Taro_032204, partial [Colocasia esculenta]|nr:hypothetical protein [Colocasia esculenta]
ERSEEDRGALFLWPAEGGEVGSLPSPATRGCYINVIRTTPWAQAIASHGKGGDRAREYAQRRKVEKFVMKLRPSLRAKLLEFDPDTLEEVLSAASKKRSRVETCQEEKPECEHCGKRHGGGVCWLKSRRCLKCGSKDHRIKECPNLKELVPRDVPATATTELPTPPKENEDYILFSEMASTTLPQ